MHSKEAEWDPAALIRGSGNVATSEGLTVSVPNSLDFRDERNGLIIRKRDNNYLKQLLCPEARS